MTIKELKESVSKLVNYPDDSFIHFKDGYEGTYAIIEKKLDDAVGREVIKISDC